MDVYFFCVTSSETLTATVTDGSIMENQNGTQTSTTTKTFSSTNQNYICHLGNVTPGSKITITASDNQAISSCYAYAFDNDAWSYDYELLNANPYTVSEYSDTKSYRYSNFSRTGYYVYFYSITTKVGAYM